jgi:hypothetical protein
MPLVAAGRYTPTLINSKCQSKHLVAWRSSTWQYVFHLECDVRGHERTVVVPVIGSREMLRGGDELLRVQPWPVNPMPARTPRI